MPILLPADRVGNLTAFLEPYDVLHSYENYVRIQVGQLEFSFHCFVWENFLPNPTLNGKSVVKINIPYIDGRRSFLYFLSLDRWNLSEMPDTYDRESMAAFFQKLGALEKQHDVYPHPLRIKSSR